MKHTAFQHIIASDVPKGAKLAPSQWGIAEGASFSSILLSIGQRGSEGVSISVADPQASPPPFNAPQQKPLFYPDGKSSSGDILPGIKTHKENPLDNIPLHTKSPALYLKDQWAKNLGNEISNAAQQAILPIPASVFINKPNDVPSGLEDPDYRLVGTSSSPMAETFQSRQVNSPTASNISLTAELRGGLSSRRKPAVALTNNTSPMPLSKPLNRQDSAAPDNQIAGGAVTSGPIQESRYISSISPMPRSMTTPDEAFTVRDIAALTNELGEEINLSVEVRANTTEPSTVMNRDIAGTMPDGAMPAQHNMEQLIPDNPAPQHSELATAGIISVSVDLPEVMTETTESAPPMINSDANNISEREMTVPQNMKQLVPDTSVSQRSEITASESMGLSAEVPKEAAETPVSSPAVMMKPSSNDSRGLPTPTQQQFRIRQQYQRLAPGTYAFQQSELANNENTRASVKAAEPALVIVEREMLLQSNRERILPDTPVFQRNEMADSEILGTQDLADIPEPAPATEMPAQRNPEQPVLDASILQQDELPNSEFVKASVEVKAEIPEQASSVDIGTASTVSATEASVQHDRGWTIPDAPILQQNELPTGESVKVSPELPIKPAEAISAVDIANDTLDREMPAQRGFEQSVPDTHSFQKNELSADDELRMAMEEPAMMGKTPEPATTVIGQNHHPSFAVYHSSDMEVPIQHKPEEANIIQKFAGEKMMKQIGNVPETHETSPEQSVLVNNESPIPYAWGQKVISEDEKRNYKGLSEVMGRKVGARVEGIPGKQVSSEVHRYLESRGVTLGNETHHIRERDAENWQERFTLEQEAEIQPVASNENVRFAQNDDEIEIPRWDTAAVERGTWLGTPDLRANETVDMTSSLNELPDRISMYTDNLINSSGENSILIQLEPKHLGKIRFRVSLKENEISAKMSVESLETKEIIELQLSDIKQSLLQHDVKITELSVSVDNGTLGSNLRNSGFSDERGDFFDNTGLGRGQTYEQGDERRSNASTGQEIMSDSQVNLLI